MRFSADDNFDPTWLQSVPGVTDVAWRHGEIVVPGRGPLLARVAAALADRQVAPSDLTGEEATLEDVFLALRVRQVRD